MTFSDVTFQILIAGVEAAALFAFWKRRALSLDAALGGPVLAGVVVAALLAQDPFHAMRLIAWQIFVHGPVVLVLVAALTWRRRRSVATVCGLGAVCLIAIAVDAFFVEPQLLETTRVALEGPKLDRALKIVVLADLQTDHVGDYERQVVADAFAERPDLIVLPGDFLQIYGPARDAEIQALRRLFIEARPSPSRGIWAVGGNVDPPGWERIFEGTPVQTIARRDTIDLGDGVFLTGLDLGASFDGSASIRRPPDARYHVVFGHAPDFALGSVDADLLIAGHTHGGQVQLPLIGPLLTLSAVPRDWAAGVTRIAHDRTLVVSRGIGLERGHAPRLRFLCRPELVIIEVAPRAR